MMDERQAVAAFAALGQEHRLRIVRHLVTAGPDGMPAGMLAEAVGVSGTNLSFHLKELSHAGLVTSRREGRSIIYSAAYPDLSEAHPVPDARLLPGRARGLRPCRRGPAACCLPTERHSHA